MANSRRREVRRNRTRVSTRAATASSRRDLAATSRRYRPEWRWKTFPVFTAFVGGMLLVFLVNGGSYNAMGFVLQIIALLGVVYALIHMIVVNVIVAGRSRPHDEARARGEAPEAAYEDVVEYTDEEST